MSNGFTMPEKLCYNLLLTGVAFYLNILRKLRLIAQFLTCSSLNDLDFSSATLVINMGERQQLFLILMFIQTINLCVNVRSFISCWSSKM